MMAIITTDDLAKDVASAEAQINLHKEHRKEIDTRAKDFSRFTQTGKNLIAQKHFLSDEVYFLFIATQKAGRAIQKQILSFFT